MGPWSSWDPFRPVDVKSGPFDYGSGRLEVNRVSRRDSEALMGLLTYVDPGPVLTKKGTPRVHQPPKHKDETAAFYEAQLIHYGLRPRKSKPAAKKALLQAAESNGGNFVVPEDILQLGERMAEEYGVKKQEQKEKHAEIRAQEKKAEEEASRKRKRAQGAIMDAASKQSSSRKKAKTGRPPKPVKLASLSGIYTVAAPEFGLSSSGSHMWGIFDFGIFEGKLRSQKLEASSFDGTINFQWRGRETGEGEMTFDPDNTAELTFLGNGMFRGTMWWSATNEFELAGKLDEDMSRNKCFREKLVRTCKSEYRRLNDSYYEVERVSRWGGTGGWGRVARSDRPDASDTSGAGHGSDEGEEDDEESQEGEDYGDEEEDYEDCP